MTTEQPKPKIEFNEQDRGRFTSASSADADAACVGRFLAQKDLPDTRSKSDQESASHGDAIHAALAKQDPAGLSVEQADIYEACCEIERNTVAKYFGADTGTVPTPTREKRFWVAWGDGHRHSARLDVVYRKATRALIIEYKTLAGDVAGSPKNRQLRDQVCVYDANTAALQEVAVVVCQPLVTYSPVPCAYSRDDIKQSLAELHHRVVSSNTPGGPRTAGEVQCRFCRAKTTCAEYNQWSSSLVLASQSIVDLPVTAWTPVMRANFLDRMDAAQKWLDGCYAALKEMLKADPQSIPGYGLKPGSKRETLTNPQAIFDAFSAKGGSLEQFFECIRITKGDLKEQLAAVTKVKGKALDKELREVIGANSEFKESEPSIERSKV